MECMILIVIYFSSSTKEIDQKLFKKRFRLNYLQIVFIVKLLILLRSISRLHWSRGLYSLEVRRYDSRQIRRKPMLTYASTVCGIAGVGEFGYCSEPMFQIRFSCIYIY